ncbi:N-acetylglucosamine kinase [Actinobacillus delphinicola]|uniref:N-acetylglucosamine kinase n=1 Tax=Actinobacillus delphinicola TaxID=51161 RepID=UPI002442A500|nr:N-acetylglucosamine kinase [Actinobacillus delphinicola]MDG6898047.1 N-acetylglucosamine kinase [Actinobacillus delphinicola]
MLYGIDIGGTKIEIAVFSENLEKLYAERVPTPHDSYENWIQTIVELVQRMDDIFCIKGQVGVGIPGFISKNTGIAEISNIPVANNRPILRDLTQALGREVRGENDANCFALSEALAIDPEGKKSVLGLILGTGFGAGFVFNGKLYAGENGMAGEIGHTPLSYPAIQLLGWDKAPIYQCGCGKKACLDSYLSGRGFARLYQDMYGQVATAQSIIEQFYARDVKAIAFVDCFIELCAMSFASIITTLDPKVIVLGGGLSNFDYLYQAIPKKLSAYLLQTAKIPRLQKAEFGDAGGARGAAALWIK